VALLLGVQSTRTDLATGLIRKRDARLYLLPESEVIFNTACSVIGHAFLSTTCEANGNLDGRRSFRENDCKSQLYSAHGHFWGKG